MMNFVVQMKTGCVTLVLCLNISVDPPDVIKISPCARMECWIGNCLFDCIFPNLLLAEEKNYSYLHLINLFFLWYLWDSAHLHVNMPCKLGWHKKSSAFHHLIETVFFLIFYISQCQISDNRSNETVWYILFPYGIILPHSFYIILCTNPRGENCITGVYCWWITTL